MKKQFHSDQQRKYFYIVVLIVIVCFMFLHGIIDMMCAKNLSYTDITQNAVGDIIRKDGREETGLSMNRWSLERGDKLIIHLKLPDENPYEYTSLAFHIYNSSVDISCDGKSLYSYGDDYLQSDRLIGNLQIHIPVSDEMAGKELTIMTVDQERLHSSKMTEFLLMKTEEVEREPLISHQTEFVVFLFLMAGGIFATITTLILSIVHQFNPNILCIGLFCTCVGAWYFGYNRLFYVMNADQRFCSVVEYYALDIAPLPLMYYLNQCVHHHRTKKVLSIISTVTYFWCIGTEIISFLPLHITMSDTLPFLQILLAAQLVFEFILIYLESRINTDNDPNRSLFRGITIGTFFAILQILSIRLSGIPGLPSFVRWLLNLDYAAIGLILLIATIVMSTTERLIVNFRKKTEEMELEHLAYIDILTGIPNRSFCVEKINDIDDSREYAIGFFDVDGLKHANDNYGHETGDALIKTAASCIADSFEGSPGFFGRWGGDEFIVCFMDAGQVPVFQKRFAENISFYSKNADLPFELSISSGYSLHIPDSGKTPTDIINEADACMYKSKQDRKKARL